VGSGGRVSGVRWAVAGVGLVAAVMLVGVLSPAAVASDSRGAAGEGAGFRATIEPVASVTQVDPARVAAATATSLGQEARALSASTAEWATESARTELDLAVGELEQELTRTIPVLDSAVRIDRDVDAVLDALAGVRADVVATAARILDTETPGAEASVRETLRAAIADQQADKPVTRETASTLAALVTAGVNARASQAAYVAEQERIAAEAAAQAAEEAAAEAAAAEADAERRATASESSAQPAPDSGFITMPPLDPCKMWGDKTLTLTNPITGEQHDVWLMPECH